VPTRPTFDALTLHAVRDELEAAIVGGVVERVALLGHDALSLEIYARHQHHFVLISIGAQGERVHLTSARPAAEGSQETPFLLLLRKHVRRGRVTVVTQPALERLLELRVTKRDDQGALRECALIIETMGRRSNAILVDERRLVLDAMRRSPPSRNPRRPVMPRQPYVYPPAQARLDPLAESFGMDLQERFQSASPEQSAAELLSGSVAGWSPQLARETVFRATRDVTSTVGQLGQLAEIQRIIEELASPLGAGRWEPCLVRSESRPVAVASYRLTHLEAAGFRLENATTITAALETAYGTVRPAVRHDTPDRRAISAEIVVRRKRCQRQIDALRRQLARGADAEALRSAGEAILASVGTLQPGATVCEFNGQTYPMDPDKTPIEMAERYFQRYRKARDAGRQLPARIESAELQLRYLDDLEALAHSLDGQAGLRRIRREVMALDGKPDASTSQVPAQRDTPSAGVLRHVSQDGTVILVGTSAASNDALTFKLSDPDDVWLHARQQPGAHVIIRCRGRAPVPDTLQTAANLAARYSRSRDQRMVPVDWTRRKHVRKIRGGPPGLVTYVKEQTIAANPAEA